MPDIHSARRKAGIELKRVTPSYWRARTELKALLNQPLPGGRGYQQKQDQRIHKLCAQILEYETPER